MELFTGNLFFSRFWTPRSWATAPGWNGFPSQNSIIKRLKKIHNIQKTVFVDKTNETSFHKAPSDLGLDLGIWFKTAEFSPCYKH